MATTNKDLSTMMSRAWAMHRNTSAPIQKTLTDAWGLQRLQDALRNGRIELVYRKKDGSIRHALATLNCGTASQQQSSFNRTPSPKVVTYWDLEVCDWRCFKCENLISWQVAQ